MHVREENEKRRATLKGGVQGKRRMSRAASYLQARNQEGEEVPPQNLDNEKSQLRSIPQVNRSSYCSERRETHRVLWEPR